ncbi:DUF2714 domain-containing protein [Mycoplasmopsis felifaucium]|uniref:DUF2714 domain-containing protein n=1 Tax=Mycoplasmopsis felifaucium TaxID=35768 RepID=A0ABZ2RV33_9BACT
MKKNKTHENSQELFNLYKEYEEIIKNDNYVSYKKIIASILLKINSGFHSEEYEEFTKVINEAINNKWDIIFDQFTIDFNIVSKFSLDTLVPILAHNESSANEAISLKSEEPSNYADITRELNAEIQKLLKENKYVEILPNLVLFVSPNTGSLKLFFDKSLTVKI